MEGMWRCYRYVHTSNPQPWVWRIDSVHPSMMTIMMMLIMMNCTRIYAASTMATVPRGTVHCEYSTYSTYSTLPTVPSRYLPLPEDWM